MGPSVNLRVECLTHPLTGVVLTPYRTVMVDTQERGTGGLLAKIEAEANDEAGT
jgi:hypothetical protein